VGRCGLALLSLTIFFGSSIHSINLTLFIGYHNTDTDIMASTSIVTLLSTWGNNNHQVSVEDLGAPVDSSQVVQWSKPQVKARFEAVDNKDPPILCPRLPAAGIPRLAAQANQDRNNQVELLRHIQENPMWPERLHEFQPLREVRYILSGRGG
jgi:hypothetical protein